MMRSMTILSETPEKPGAVAGGAQKDAERVLVVGFRSLDALATHHRSGREILGIEIDPARVREASEQLGAEPLASIRIACASVLGIPEPSESFDRALCHAVLHEVEDVKSALNELQRVLRQGGILEIADFTRVSRRAFARYRQAAQEEFPDEPFLDVHRGFRRRSLTRLVRAAGFEVCVYRRLDSTWTLGPLRVPPFRLEARRL